MITIWVPKRLVEIDLYNVAAQSPAALAEMSEKSYRQRVAYAAQKIRDSRAKIVMLTGPSASGKTTSAHKVAEALEASGTPAHVISLDNFFKGAQYYPRLPDGTLDYENPDTLDMSLIRQCLSDLSTTGKTVLPIYDFTTESRSSETETLDLKGGVCIVEGIHALNPELTGLVKGDDVYRIYAGLREEYCIDGRRVINTQDIRLCRRTLRDAAARGRSPAKTLAMWDRVLDGETRYIKGFKTTADFLLDTSFTYELGLIAKLLRPVSQRFTLEGHNAELWDETARRFEHVAPVELELLPAALPDALRAHSSSLLTDLTAQDLLILDDTLEFLADRSAAIHTEALPGGWDGEHYTLTDDSHAAVQTLFNVSPTEAQLSSASEP
jgi:uridine kinase